MFHFKSDYPRNLQFTLRNYITAYAVQNRNRLGTLRRALPQIEK